MVFAIGISMAFCTVTTIGRRPSTTMVHASGTSMVKNTGTTIDLRGCVGVVDTNGTNTDYYTATMTGHQPSLCMGHADGTGMVYNIVTMIDPPVSHSTHITRMNGGEMANNTVTTADRISLSATALVNGSGVIGYTAPTTDLHV